MEQRFSLDEIAQLAGIPKRRVRFYIQRGLVDRPLGDAPRTAYYTARHLEQVLRVLRLQAEGLSLARIAEIVRGGEEQAPSASPGAVEVWTRIVLADGVELHLHAERAGLAPEAVRALAAEIQAALRRLRTTQEEETP